MSKKLKLLLSFLSAATVFLSLSAMASFPPEVDNILSKQAISLENFPVDFKINFLLSFGKPKSIDMILNKDHSLDLIFYGKEKNDEGQRKELKRIHYNEDELNISYKNKKDGFSFKVKAKKKQDSLIGMTLFKYEYTYLDANKLSSFQKKIKQILIGKKVQNGDKWQCNDVKFFEFFPFFVKMHEKHKTKKMLKHHQEEEEENSTEERVSE